MKLSTRNLSVGYPQLFKVEVENLEFKTPGLYPILGRNGTGKSTFLMVLAGLLPPLEGNVFYEEKDLRATTLSDLARYRSILTTDRSDLLNLKVRELLEWSLPPKSSLNRDEIVEHFGISSFWDKNLSHLSDGQRQRVLIARAFFQDTPTIFLDEPTTFLDYEGREEILNLLKDLALEKEKIILMSTHEQDWVKKNLSGKVIKF